MNNKFSSCEELYASLEGFIRHLAGRYCNNDIMFEFDELVGELSEELVKGFAYYDKKDLTKDQMKAVIRRMMDNRISELRHRHYGTHRGLSKLNISIDLSWDEDDDRSEEEELADDSVSVEEYVLSIDRLRVIRIGLSPLALRILDACIFGNNPRMSQFLLLSAMRSKTTGRHIKAAHPWVIANALMISERDARNAIKEIKEAYKEVCCG